MASGGPRDVREDKNESYDNWKRKLTKSGDFMVQKSPKDEVVLLYRENDDIISRNIRIGDPDEKTEEQSYSSVQSFIQKLCDKSATDLSQMFLRDIIIEDDWLLKIEDIEMEDKIGQGYFSRVFKAKYKRKVVAVKKYKDGMSDEKKRRFLLEGSILGQMSHPNIIEFIGLTINTDNMMIATEYMRGGDLHSYLTKPEVNLSIRDMVLMCRNVVSGMAYLEQKKCIHRDLAARNCLVDLSDGLKVKISDFGMSRLEDKCSVSDADPIPFRWAAPEVLRNGPRTSKSDVWSFAILMWEIFSKGATPYQDTAINIDTLYNELSLGLRLLIPQDTPERCERLMKCCWEFFPESRCTFSTIESSF